MSLSAVSQPEPSPRRLGAEAGFTVELPDVGYWRRQICCQEACPVHTDSRGYVRTVAAGDYRRAYLIARGPNPLASICGRVCGAPCEAACRRGDYDQPIAIRALKRFACERAGVEALLKSDGAAPFVRDQVFASGSGVCDAIDEIALLRRAIDAWKAAQPADATKPRVAIVGSGPAGLAAAHDLALLGLSPVIFEAEPVPAGMLYLGVPEYRLPRELIRAEVAVIESLGVEIRCGVEVGRDVHLADLKREFAAVILAVGAKRSRQLKLPGLDGPGVLGGVDFLRDVALSRPPKLGRRVLVIGGGNVAYDVARTSLRQTYFDAARSALRQPEVGEVHLACLESRAEMPADDVEVHEGDEEGVVRHNSVGPVAIRRDEHGRVLGVEFQRVLRVFDEQGRFSPTFDPGQKEFVAADTVILSIGQSCDFSFIEPATCGIELTDRGLIKLNAATLATTAAGVYVAGDAAHGTKLMIDAIASGKQAARSVYARLTGRSIAPQAVEIHAVIGDYLREKDYEKIARVDIPTASVQERLAHPGAPVERGYGPGEAEREAGRCLDCGVNTIFDGEKCVLCGGCADVCPTLCLKLVGADELAGPDALAGVLERQLGAGSDPAAHSAIIKDETLCIRCANCAHRCPTGAITMERFSFQEPWT